MNPRPVLCLFSSWAGAQVCAYMQNAVFTAFYMFSELMSFRSIFFELLDLAVVKAGYDNCKYFLSSKCKTKITQPLLEVFPDGRNSFPGISLV